MPLPQLLLACREHLGRFRRGAENDPRYCLELFRRAVDARDGDAWHGLVDLYRPLLLSRLLQRGVAPDLAEEAVQEAFVALWLKSEGRAFSTYDHTLAQVLNYLWGSVRFALIRLRRQQREIALETDGEAHPRLTSSGDETLIESTLDARALLRRVRKLVTAHEWQVLWLRFGPLRSDPQLRTFDGR
jgi:DNA-directed RNA polymerase specialized sigma24 family protein